ncbi:MAG TPA: hypothetical protein DCE42_09385 [Myxococcales bacterium]|nr:hypothetical protein [Deltaproteobacteria bacterium]HAA54958.1 hypothetical protein [Myxococcales bacterium]|tara:strand:+ start:3061 stop:4404 length:1344 start_codon:yes stop_codon:yes gene_type:complete
MKQSSQTPNMTTAVDLMIQGGKMMRSGWIVLLVLMGGCLSGCVWPYYGFSQSQMKSLIRIDNVKKELKVLRQKQIWSNTSKFTPNVVMQGWRPLRNKVARINSIAGRNKEIHKFLQTRMLSGYYGELGHRIDLMISRRQYRLARKAALGLWKGAPKANHADEALGLALGREADQKKSKYPGLAAYYYYTAASLMKDSGDTSHFRKKANELADAIHRRMALRLNVSVRGSMRAMVSSKLKGIFKKRFDTILGGGGVRLSISHRNPYSSRRMGRGSRSKRYVAGTKRIRYRYRNGDYYSKLVKRYATYTYSTRIYTLKTSIQAQGTLRRGSRTVKRWSGAGRITLQNEGWDSVSRVGLYGRSATYPSESAGRKRAVSSLANNISRKFVTPYIQALGRRFIRRYRGRGGDVEINACAEYLIHFKVATSRERAPITQRLKSLTKLDYGSVP